MGLLLLLSAFLLPVPTTGHGTMVRPAPRQPESVYWYQVGCLIGCTCSGGGKEEYPSPDSMACTPMEPTHTAPASLTWNAHGASPRAAWNRYMPWRAPGFAVPLDSCGIASGFLPSAAVQYPHAFARTNEGVGGAAIAQGDRGTALPVGPISTWTAGSIVEASFYLNVNHGGGYQYRVCPRREAVVPDEACFERHPLAFATDAHVVVRGNGERIAIPATDVTTGTRPTGSAWRRIPIPACNCDAGASCRAADADDDFRTAYGDGEPYGSCSTGLQFEAPHIVDQSWPEGYGYYVASLGGYTGGKGESHACHSHLNSTTCHEDSEASCRWYPQKNICYEIRDDGDDNKGDDKGDGGSCHLHSTTGEASCVQEKTASGDSCTWYESADKAACYDKSEKEQRRATSEEEGDKGTKGKGDGRWHIADRLRAPAEAGDYVLQWRWDNEQTPQIWTTCADVVVVADAAWDSDASAVDAQRNASRAATRGKAGWALWLALGILLPL